jgi:hypothetical protein
LSQVLPIEREQIKGEVSGKVAPLHYGSKDASAEMIDHRKLAIQDCRFRVHLFHQRRSKVLIASEPVASWKTIGIARAR